METHGSPQASYVQDAEVREDEPTPDDQAAGLAPFAQVYSSGPGLILHLYVPWNPVPVVSVDYCVRGHVTLHVAFQLHSRIVKNSWFEPKKLLAHPPFPKLSRRII